MKVNFSKARHHLKTFAVFRCTPKLWYCSLAHYDKMGFFFVTWDSRDALLNIHTVLCSW